MEYPIAIEVDNDTHIWGIVVPDLPGCFSTGNTINEAIENTKESMQAWLEAQIDKGGTVRNQNLLLSINLILLSPDGSGQKLTLIYLVRVEYKHKVLYRY